MPAFRGFGQDIRPQRESPRIEMAKAIEQEGPHFISAEHGPTLESVDCFTGRAVRVLLLGRYEVELAGAFLIEEGAFGFVAAAPVFVAAGDEDIFARADTFFAGVILI